MTALDNQESDGGRKRRRPKQQRRDRSKPKPKVEQSMDDIVKKYDGLILKDTDYGKKIVNTVTGHELKATKDNLLIYLNSKDYKKSVENWYKDGLFEKYLPHIVPNKKNDKKLMCKLTKTALNKIPAEIEKHVQGKNYLKKLKEWKNLQEKLQKATKPNEDSSDAMSETKEEE